MALSRQSLPAVTARDLGSSCGAFISLGGSQRLKRHSSKRQLRGGHYASEAQATPRVDVGDPPEASSFHLCAELSKSNDHLSSRVASRVVLCCQLGLGVRWMVRLPCLLSVPFRRGRVLFWHVEVNRVHSRVGWMRQFRQQACEGAAQGVRAFR